ncbi:MAG: hypothetical protein AB1635_14765 [Acidobacteriota bacterium]
MARPQEPMMSRLVRLSALALALVAGAALAIDAQQGPRGPRPERPRTLKAVLAWCRAAAARRDVGSCCAVPFRVSADCSSGQLRAAILAQVSFSDTVRLNTGAPGRVSASAQK